MSKRIITVNNPFSGEMIGEVPGGSDEEIAQAIHTARDGARQLRALPLHRRAEILAATAKLLREQESALGALITQEAGKTIRESRAEVLRAAGIFQYAAEETRRLHGETIPFDAFANSEGRTGYWTREPLGIVGAITPWNVPLALAAHKIAPAIATGNAVVHKPAEQTPFNALKLRELLLAAGLPHEALQVVTGTGKEAGDALVTHPQVDFLSFTGSRAVGMQIPARAGFKRVALELGGNSPVIITPTANLREAAAAIVRGGFTVAGQLCISVQRILVQKDCKEALLAEMLPQVAALKVGDPLDPTTDVGSLISKQACDRVAEQVTKAIRDGAALMAGGKRLGDALYAPTVLDHVDVESALAREEAFAPLVLVTAYGSFDEAIALANSTPYGLNAGIFTNDLQEALLAAKDIDAGTVLINDVPTFRSDLMPYGGRKESGLGREGIRFAMEEMTDLKVVCVRPL